MASDISDTDLDYAIDSAVEEIADEARVAITAHYGVADVRVEADRQIRHLLKKLGVKYGDGTELIRR